MIFWRTRINRVVFALLLTGTLLVPAVVSYAQPTDPSRSQTPDSPFLTLDEEALLVLEVRIGSKGAGRGLIGYQFQDITLLPLGELCSILELGIMVDAKNGTAQGWTVDESRTFNLNLEAQTIALNGNLTPLPQVYIGYDENDIYIQSTILEQWLPVDLEVNLPRMHVKITPREPLPFQSRLKRDEQRSYWLSRHGNESDKYPMQQAPYRMWSYPVVDATAGFLAGRQRSSTRLALQSHADLAGLSTDLFVSHLGRKDNNQTLARLKAGRWDPEGGLWGPAGVTRYEFGDLYISRVPLISTSKKGLGFMISNMSINRSREIDHTEIQGDAPPGWEAELYINGVLYDFQTVGETGRYVFRDVPMVFGNNIFRTVLYGPRGEKKEIVRNANLSTEMSDVGKLKYKFILVQGGKGLLTTPPSQDYISDNSWNQQLELSVALASKHALVANFSRLKIEGNQELFSSLTSHNSLGRIYLESILAKSVRGGAAFSLAARGRLRGQNLFASHSASSNYRAEAYYGNSYLNRQTQVRSSGNILNRANRTLFYNLSATSRGYDEKDLLQDNEVKFSLATNFGRFMLSHNIRYLEKKYRTLATEEIQGTQLARIQVGPVSLRSDLNYEVSPGRLRSVGASMNWFRTDRVQLAARGAHFLKPEYGNDNLGADLTIFFDKFSLGATYSYFESGGSSIGLTLGTSLARDNRSRCFAVQHRSLANHSVASVRAYIDLNGNRAFDEEDEPLGGVGFLNHSAWRKIRTNDEGLILLTGLQVHRTQTIKLDLSTVDDPYLVPISEGVNVVGHPGSFVDVDFPFSYIGEMEGLVLDAQAMDVPLRHVGLEVLDSEGNRVKTTVGEFDGYYYFSELFPGEYRLGVVSTTVNTNVYDLPEPVPFLIPPEGGFVTGPDIVLNRKDPQDIEEPVIAVVTPEEVEAETQPAIETKPEETVTVQLESEDPSPSEEKAAVAGDETVEVAVVQEPETSTEPEPDVVAEAPTKAISPELSALLAKADPDQFEEDYPAFDKELTLSLVYEVLYRNSLWPDDPAP